MESLCQRQENEPVQLVANSENSAGYRFSFHSPEIEPSSLSVELIISNHRQGRAMWQLDLQLELDKCSSTPFNYPKAYQDALRAINVQPLPICEPFVIIALGEIAEMERGLECPICCAIMIPKKDEEKMEPNSLMRTRNCCKQAFHTQCYLKWLDKRWERPDQKPSNCPYCRMNRLDETHLELEQLRIDKLLAGVFEDEI